MLKSTNTENNFVSEPPKEPIVLPVPHKIGDKVTFGMPWMGGRIVSVSAVIQAIDAEAENALLTFIGFFDSGDETGIEPLAHLYPWTPEDQENLDSFAEDGSAVMTPPPGQDTPNDK